MSLNITDAECDQMHRAAVKRINTLEDALLDGVEETAYSLAPYCGCTDCMVREILDAAYLKLEELR